MWKKIPGGVYRKFVVGLVGMIATVLSPVVLGITPGDQFFGIGQEIVVQTVMGLLTSIGVRQAPNEE
ncbi:MAG: hypothetical protein LC667_02200 [Thioalkalivibrio sp.]|nr:hypothetical protein [Thioalkalivibrio sp.]